MSGRSDQVDRRKEQRLVLQAQKGNVKAFEELVLEHQKIIYNIIYRIMNNPEDTYDLSQETFIKAYTNIKQYNKKSKFSTWLYRIATNASLDELRRRKGKQTFSTNQVVEGKDNEMILEYEDASENVEEKIVKQEKTDIVACALKELNKNHRTILVLREMQGLSYDEISQILDITLGTVKSRISRARQEMKAIIMQDKEPYASYFRHTDIRRDES